MTLAEVLAFLREDAYPYYARQEEDDTADWRDGAFRALLQSLSEEDLTRLAEALELDAGCPRLLYYKACEVLKSKERAILARIPTQTLLRWYSDKRSGKVGMAAKALAERFPRESVEIRHTILKKFLGGNQKDMEWASRYLRVHWTRSMSSLVRCRWRETHNPVIAQVVIRHLPDDFVMAEKDRLADVAGYPYVCARLVKVKGFVIDESRLSTPDYLYVIAKGGRGMADHSVIEERLDSYLNEDGWTSSRDLGLVLWALGQLGLSETIIRRIPAFERRMGKATAFEGMAPFGLEDNPF